MYFGRGVPGTNLQPALKHIPCSNPQTDKIVVQQGTSIMVFVRGFPVELLRMILLLVVPEMSAESPTYLLTLSLVCKEFR